MRILLFLMIAAFLLRLPLCLNPPEVLVAKAASDDMFYYLCIARNISQGYGATVDRENATNGFHPLWALMLVPVTALLGERGALQCALALLTLFSVLSAWFLYRLARSACGVGASLLAAIVWLCSPYTVIVALAGTEAPLFVCLLGAVALGYLRLSSAPGGGAPSRWAALGALAGAAVLARIDGGLLAVLVCADLLLGPGGRGMGTRARAGRACVFALSCALAALPWFLWSYARTGYLFQTSGKAIYLQQHLIFWAEHVDSGEGRRAAAWLAAVLANARAAAASVGALSGAGARMAGGALALCAAGAAAAGLAKPRLFMERLKACARLAFLFCYGALMFLAYCVYLWYNQDWYYYSVVFAACVFAACVIDLLVRCFAGGLPRAARAAGAAACAACAIAFCVSRTAGFWERGIRGWQIDAYRAALWAKEHLPPRARIGSFNSGIAAYYCPQQVINLDGVVNGAAYRAASEGRIFSYIVRAGITHLIESPLSLRFRAVGSWGDRIPRLKELHAECSYPEAAARRNPVIVYEVER